MPNWAEFDDEALAKGYTVLPNVAWDIGLPPGPLAVYMKLLRSSQQNAECCPSIEEIAADCCCSVRSARAWRGELAEKYGVIEMPEGEKRRRQGRRVRVRFLALSRPTSANGAVVEGAKPRQLAPCTIKKEKPFKKTDSADAPNASDTPRLCGWCCTWSETHASPVHDLLQFYHNAFKNQHQTCPELLPARFGKQFKALLKTHPVEDLRACLLLYVRSRKPFAQGARWSLPVFFSDFHAVWYDHQNGHEHGQPLT